MFHSVLPFLLDQWLISFRWSASFFLTGGKVSCPRAEIQMQTSDLDSKRQPIEITSTIVTKQLIDANDANWEENKT